MWPALDDRYTSFTRIAIDTIIRHQIRASDAAQSNASQWAEITVTYVTDNLNSVRSGANSNIIIMTNIINYDGVVSTGASARRQYSIRISTASYIFHFISPDRTEPPAYQLNPAWFRPAIRAAVNQESLPDRVIVTNSNRTVQYFGGRVCIIFDMYVITLTINRLNDLEKIKPNIREWVTWY